MGRYYLRVIKSYLFHKRSFKVTIHQASSGEIAPSEVGTAKIDGVECSPPEVYSTEVATNTPRVFKAHVRQVVAFVRVFVLLPAPLADCVQNCVHIHRT